MNACSPFCSLPTEGQPHFRYYEEYRKGNRVIIFEGALTLLGMEENSQETLSNIDSIIE